MLIMHTVISGATPYFTTESRISFSFTKRCYVRNHTNYLKFIYLVYFEGVILIFTFIWEINKKFWPIKSLYFLWTSRTLNYFSMFMSIEYMNMGLRPYAIYKTGSIQITAVQIRRPFQLSFWNNFLISARKHTFWELIRIVSARRFEWAPQRMFSCRNKKNSHGKPHLNCGSEITVHSLFGAHKCVICTWLWSSRQCRPWTECAGWSGLHCWRVAYFRMSVCAWHKAVSMWYCRYLSVFLH